MEKQKKFNYVIICGLLVTLIMMSIGYATLAQTLNMSGTATIKSASNSWNVHFSNVTPDQGNTASWKTAPSISTDQDLGGSDNKITFACELIAPGDWCSAKATIKNGGDIVALFKGYTFEVDDTEVTDLTTTTSDGVVITLTPATDWIEDKTTLNKDDVGEFTIKMELPSDITSLPTQDASHKVSLTLDFDQNTQTTTEN